MKHDDLYQEAIDYYSERIQTNPGETFRALWHDGYTWKGRLILVPLNIWGNFVMARGKNGSVPAAKEKATWNTTFVDIPLTGVSEDELYGHFKSTDEVYEQANALLENGYRLGFSYNPQNDAFICSVTCKDEASVNTGKTFTAFAGAWFDALMVALYKHYVVAGQNWTKNSSTVERAKFG